MTKFTAEDKLKAIHRYVNGNESFASIGSSMGTAKSEVIKWVQLYQHHGTEAFTKPYTGYSTQFKLDVLNFMNEQGTSIRETSARFNISSHSSLIRWKKQVELQGIDALESKKKGRPAMKKENKKGTHVEGSVEALQEELERLRMENAYLKKLNALVQSKEKLQSKTKRK